MKERTQEKMVLYWRVAGVTLVGGGEPWVKPIATEGESVAGLMLGNEDVPQIFFLFENTSNRGMNNERSLEEEESV